MGVPVPDPIAFRRRLLRWYDQGRRDLPWRQSPHGPAPTPWQILVSEIMLQQTRVETVIPYYQRFLARFPDPAALARAAESEILAAWSGLGYYSRVRNLQKAAARISAQWPETFPSDFDQLRALPGIGPYTAAAVASIAFGRPHAAVDGNVLRVLARVTADSGDIASTATRRCFAAIAQQLLAPARPGDFNQAMMELGATVCLPRDPLCLVCPVARNCAARLEGRQRELPVKRPKSAPAAAQIEVLIARRGNRILLRQRGAAEKRMACFWELPSPQDLLAALPTARLLEPTATFRHTIVNTAYTVTVRTAIFPTANVRRSTRGLAWVSLDALGSLPLTTLSRKALASSQAFSNTS